MFQVTQHLLLAKDSDFSSTAETRTIKVPGRIISVIRWVACHSQVNIINRATWEWVVQSVVLNFHFPAHHMVSFPEVPITSTAITTAPTMRALRLRTMPLHQSKVTRPRFLTVQQLVMVLRLLTETLHTETPCGVPSSPPINTVV